MLQLTLPMAKISAPDVDMWKTLGIFATLDGLLFHTLGSNTSAMGCCLDFLYRNIKRYEKRRCCDIYTYPDVEISILRFALLRNVFYGASKWKFPYRLAVKALRV